MVFSELIDFRKTSLEKTDHPYIQGDQRFWHITCKHRKRIASSVPNLLEVQYVFAKGEQL